MLNLNTTSNIPSSPSVNRLGVILTVALILAALASITPALAFPAGHGGDRFLERMTEKLDLNTTQRDQIKQIHRDNRGKAMALHDAMQDNMEALHKLDPGRSGYQQQVAQLAKEQGDLMRQMIIHRAGVKAQLFAVLTPEQRKRAAELSRQHPRHGMGHHRMPDERRDRGAF